MPGSSDRSKTQLKAQPKAQSKPKVPNFSASDIQLTLVDKKVETSDVMTFCFQVECEAGPFKYHPGQAISLRVPSLRDETNDGTNAELNERVHTFTIASPPSPGSNLGSNIELTVKAAPSGNATRYMHEQLQVGVTLSARGPFGHFSLVHHPNKALLLIGAGSGMTPLMSMLRWLHQRQEQVDVVLIQQASRPTDLLFTDELRQIDAQLPNLRRFDCVSSVPDGEDWSGLRGRLQRPGLRTIVPDLGQRTVFCCGPTGFTDSIHGIFRAEGGLPENFQTETFGASAELVVDVTAKPEVDVAQGYQIDIDGYRFMAAPTVSLVDAAAASGIRIPTSCREGNCGTCKLKLVSGDVSMEHIGGLSKKEEQQGYVLACSARACSDLVMTRKNL